MNLSCHYKSVFFIAFFLVFSTKAALIHLYAVDLPWADQWDGEIEKIYYSYLDGSLGWQQFWSQANEHRIVFTKLVDLIVFTVFDNTFRQDIVLYVQAAVFAAAAAAGCAFVAKDTGSILRVLAAGLVFLPAFDWENLYWSYQSQVYFALLFCILGAYAISRPQRNTYTIVVLIALACLSNASAAYLAVCALFVSLIDFRPEKKSYFEVGLYAAITLFIMQIWVPKTPWHDQFKAQSVGDVVDAFLRFFEWPSDVGFMIWAVLIVMSGLIALKFIRRKETVSSAERFGMVLSAWFALFLISSILRRAGFPEIPNRYYTYYLIGLLALSLFSYRLPQKKWIKIALLSVCVLVGVFSYAELARKTHAQWVLYAGEKSRNLQNFTDVMRFIAENPSAKESEILERMKVNGLPFAGYPNFEIPLQVMQHPHAPSVFSNYLE